MLSKEDIDYCDWETWLSPPFMTFIHKWFLLTKYMDCYKITILWQSFSYIRAAFCPFHSFYLKMRRNTCTLYILCYCETFDNIMQSLGCSGKQVMHGLTIYNGVRLQCDGSTLAFCQNLGHSAISNEIEQCHNGIIRVRSQKRLFFRIEITP